jgi:phosphoglycolate phosphatase/pyrophosphatase PpaX
MLRYSCIVLDHDDTVVQSEASVNYPAFLEMLHVLRPGQTLTLDEFTLWCFERSYTAMCMEHFGLSQEEMLVQYELWKDYVRTHVPPCYEGFGPLLCRYRAQGGRICVSSHSGVENITRDYAVHFGLQPDRIYSWDLPEARRKPDPFALQDAMEFFRLPPEQLLVVDDLKPGFDMARKCGVDFACAGWSCHLPQIEAFMRAHSDYYLTKVSELEALLFL